jgi:alcohol dehydrogenase class IV
MIDGICREGMKRAARSLRTAYHNGSDADARQDMALTSLFGGLALANAGLGAVHGFAGPFGGMFTAPHGATCAAFLPFVMDVNVRVLQEREPDSSVLQRYDEVAQILTGDQTATANSGVTWLKALCEELEVPSLGSYGATESDFPQLIEKASRSSSMKANPVNLRPEDMEDILRRAL